MQPVQIRLGGVLPQQHRGDLLHQHQRLLHGESEYVAAQAAPPSLHTSTPNMGPRLHPTSRMFLLHKHYFLAQVWIPVFPPQLSHPSPAPWASTRRAAESRPAATPPPTERFWGSPTRPDWTAAPQTNATRWQSAAPRPPRWPWLASAAPPSWPVCGEAWCETRGIPPGGGLKLVKLHIKMMFSTG